MRRAGPFASSLLALLVLIALVVAASVRAAGDGTASGTGTGTGTGSSGSGPAIIDATYRVHYVDVLNTRHAHSADDAQYTAQHGGDTSSWSYDTAVLSVAFDDALYLNRTSLLDALYFVSLAPHNRQILYGLTRLHCDADAAAGRPARTVESYPSHPPSERELQAQYRATAANASDGEGDDAAAWGAAMRDAYDARRSELHQSGSVLWPLAGAGWSRFTWLHALKDEDHITPAASGAAARAAASTTAGSSAGAGASSSVGVGGGYRAYNRLEWALLLGYTTPSGERHTFLTEQQLASCRIEFLPKHAQTSDWFAAQELTNRAGEPALDSARLQRYADAGPARHRVVSQHSDDVSFLEERTEVGAGAGLDADASASVGIPGLSALISALVDEILGPDVKRVADFVTVRLDHRLLGLLAKYVGGSDIPGVYKLWNLLQIEQTVTPYTPKPRPDANAHAGADSDGADDSDGVDADDADADDAGADADDELPVLLDVSKPKTADAKGAAKGSTAAAAGQITTGAGGKPLTAVQRKAAERMASAKNPLNQPLTTVSLAAVDASAHGGAGAATAAGAASKQTIRALALRYQKWRSHTSLPAAFVPRFPVSLLPAETVSQLETTARMYAGAGAKARSRSRLGSREVIEPDGVMTRNIITSLAKLLSVTVSVALTESLVEALNEDMRDLILPPLREYLPLRMTPIVTRGLVQPLVVALTETITNGVERVVPAVVLSRLKHTLVHTLTRGVTHSVGSTLMYTLRDASHLEPVCWQCYYVDRSYCDMCSYLRRRQDKLAPAYHDLYYTDYFASYYSDWYADIFTYSINPKDPPGTFSGNEPMIPREHGVAALVTLTLLSFATAVTAFDADTCLATCAVAPDDDAGPIGMGLGLAACASSPNSTADCSLCRSARNAPAGVGTCVNPVMCGAPCNKHNHCANTTLPDGTNACGVCYEFACVTWLPPGAVCTATTAPYCPPDAPLCANGVCSVAVCGSPCKTHFDCVGGANGCTLCADGACSVEHGHTRDRPDSVCAFVETQISSLSRRKTAQWRLHVQWLREFWRASKCA